MRDCLLYSGMYMPSLKRKRVGVGAQWIGGIITVQGAVDYQFVR